MFCTKCGNELTGNDKFCRECGQAVGNVSQEENPVENVSELPEKKMIKRYLLILFFILVFLTPFLEEMITDVINSFTIPERAKNICWDLGDYDNYSFNELITTDNCLGLAYKLEDTDYDQEYLENQMSKVTSHELFEIYRAYGHSVSPLFHQKVVDEDNYQLLEMLLESGYFEPSVDRASAKMVIYLNAHGFDCHAGRCVESGVEDGEEWSSEYAYGSYNFEFNYRYKNEYDEDKEWVEQVLISLDTVNYLSTFGPADDPYLFQVEKVYDYWSGDTGGNEEEVYAYYSEVMLRIYEAAGLEYSDFRDLYESGY